MNTLLSLLLLAGACCASVPSDNNKALHQFRNMILCMIPDSWPILEFANYGCYCGRGGSGTPVDDLDRCCQVHDQCYGEAMQQNQCWPFDNNPYIALYAYRCNKAKRTLTCGRGNNACKMFICECDRKAAECFARSPWIPEHHHLPSDRCQDSTSVSSQGGQIDLNQQHHTGSFMISLLRLLLFFWSLFWSMY